MRGIPIVDRTDLPEMEMVECYSEEYSAFLVRPDDPAVVALELRMTEKVMRTHLRMPRHATVERRG